jgi:hypothetical protein
MVVPEQNRAGPMGLLKGLRRRGNLRGGKLVVPGVTEGLGAASLLSLPLQRETDLP